MNLSSFMENERKEDEDDEVESPIDKRLHRSRRRSIFYNPQDCPAWEWQSDGVFEWKILSQSEKGTADIGDEKKSRVDARAGINTKENGINEWRQDDEETV